MELNQGLSLVCFVQFVYEGQSEQNTISAITCVATSRHKILASEDHKNLIFLWQKAFRNGPARTRSLKDSDLGTSRRMPTTRCFQILTALLGSYEAPCESIFKRFMRNEIT